MVYAEIMTWLIATAFLMTVISAPAQPTNNHWSLDSERCWDVLGYCITLYESSNGITWSQAVDNCEAEDKSILTIEEISTQKSVAHFLAQTSAHSNEAYEAWIGGKRAVGNALSTINGRKWGVLTYPGGSNIINNNCVISRRMGQGNTYFFDNCHETSGHHSIICQHSTTDTCKPEWNNTTLVNDICFSTIFVWDGSTNTQSYDWYAAQRKCNEITGAYVIEDGRDSTLSGLLSDQNSVWLGYWRKHWYWINETVRMVYFNWKENFGDSGESDLCTVIDGEGEWVHTTCNNTKTFYLCINDTADNGAVMSSTPLTSMAISLESQNTVFTTRNSVTTDSVKTDSTSSNISSFHDMSRTMNYVTESYATTYNAIVDSKKITHIAIYAGSSGGAVVLVALIAVAIVCGLRKRKDRMSNSQQAATDANEQEVTDTEFITGQQNELRPDDFIPKPNNSNNDTVTPYAEFGEPAQGDTGINHILDDPGSSVMGPGEIDPYGEVGGIRVPMENALENGTRVESNDSESVSNPIVDVYAQVNKSKIGGEHDEEDMEDVVVDNPTYGGYGE